MRIFSGSSNKLLAEKIAESLHKSLSPVEIFVFPDGERRIRIEEDVLNEDVVIVAPTTPPVDQNYMELFFLVDGAKRSGAKTVTVAIPYLGYQRQDHVFRSGEAVSFQVIVTILESIGVDRVIACDLHTVKIPEFFNIPFIHISALPLFAEKIVGFAGPSTVGFASRSEALDSMHRSDVWGPVGRQTAGPASRSSQNAPASLGRFQQPANADAPFGSPPLASPANKSHDTILVTPDMGGIRRIKILSEMLDDIPYVAIEKDRDLATGKVEVAAVHGDVNVKKAVIVDDMISSGKTIVNAAKVLQEKGVEEILVFATHPIFSDEAPVILQSAPVEKVYVTDTVLIPDKKRFAKLEVLSVAPVIAVHIVG